MEPDRRSPVTEGPRHRRAAATPVAEPDTAPVPVVDPAPVTDSGGSAAVPDHGRGHGQAAPAGRPDHGHGHGPAAPVGRPVRLLVALLLIPAALATLVGLFVLHPYGEGPDPAPSAPRIPGQVTAAELADCDPGSGDGGCIALTVRLDGGPAAGSSVTVPASVVRGVVPYDTGDPVVLVLLGDDPADAGSYQIADFQRGVPLAALGLLFAGAVVVLGRWRGLAALVGLGLTAAVLIVFILPALLAGRDPLAVAVVGSAAIMFAALFLTHGFSARTATAVLGTMLSLMLIGLLGLAFTAATRLTGLGEEDTSNLANTLGANVDGRGLILAGLIIGALGALDDVTVTQTSAVWELHRADPRASPAELLAAAMRIGREHVAAAVNTLVLAYTGAALPLLLVFSVAGRGLVDTLTTEVIATEAVRTLVGSIGLVASVPLTTAVAAAVVTGGVGPHRHQKRQLPTPTS